jgi:glycosyltransferase involved in cell wall biosynthesis
MLATVVISTYNRADALPATLEALGRQDLPPNQYEVLVIDDGSSDDTAVVLEKISAPYELRVYRLPTNKGVSAGRNVGLRNARGRFIITMSDDLIVPRDFISMHVATLERFPNRWIIGGFSQLEALTNTPFGRYLDGLERLSQQQRLGEEIEDGIYEMSMPTARNLSLPRSDLDRVGLFDEQFRVTCEDIDLVRRASAEGISFLYNASLECTHNDQAADLYRYCRFQERGARDTARLAAKYPYLDGQAPVVRANGRIDPADNLTQVTRKTLKRALAAPLITGIVESSLSVAERLPAPERALYRGYRLLIGLYMFRGFRAGLRELDTQDRRCDW